MAGDEDWFVEQAGQAKSEITHVIDTHIHADHYSGGRKLAAPTGAAYCLHESNQGFVKFPFTPLRDGQTIEAGNTIVKVMHTPGHTPDGMSLVVTDKLDTLQTRILPLPDTLEIFPGHQAGSVCGAGLSGKASSTLGFEKRWNPALSISNREKFIEHVVREVPVRPAGMDQIIATNVAG